MIKGVKEQTKLNKAEEMKKILEKKKQQKINKAVLAESSDEAKDSIDDPSSLRSTPSPSGDFQYTKIPKHENFKIFSNNVEATNDTSGESSAASDR